MGVERIPRQLRPEPVQGTAQRFDSNRQSLSRGLEILQISRTWVEGFEDRSIEASYYTWVDQHNTVGLGENIPISTANLNDGFVALKNGKMILVRIPYPMGF
jgi:hypothetical protein